MSEDNETKLIIGIDMGHPNGDDQTCDRSELNPLHGSTENRYDTSKRIKYATDEWGGRDETHLEIEWNGKTLMIDITDERIHMVGPCFEVDKTSMNAMDITPSDI